MPPEDELKEDLIQQYEDVRVFFLRNPDDRCVPLFLNSFGDGLGSGVYQLVEDVLHRCSPDAVRAALPEALASPHPGVRWWSAQVAADYSDRSFVPRLVEIVSGEYSDDERWAAAFALQYSMDPVLDRETVAALLSIEQDPEVGRALVDGLGRRSDP